MRSRKPRTGLLITVLLMLAVLQLAVGIFTIYMVKAYRDQAAPETKVDEQIEQEEQDVLDDEDVDGQDDVTDENDPGFIADPEEDDDEDDEDDEADPEEDDDEDDDKDYVMMTVQAPDNYAAVRAGRGTTYEEVGRINNGSKVALTDLKNGWYRIAKGQYKGYYTHQSSYVAG